MATDATSDLLRVGMKQFFHITSQWHATEEQQRRLLGVQEYNQVDLHEASAMEIEAVCHNDLMLRLSHLQCIYSLLHTLFQEERQANAWPGKINDHFDGRSALDIMAAKDLSGLIVVRNYLEQQFA